MKIAVSTACVVAAIVPMVATFSPIILARRANMNLHAAADDTSDIVKAYAKKGKIEAKLPDITISSPADIPTPEVEPVVTLPDVQVDVPEIPPDIQTAVKETVIQINAQATSLGLKEKADDINAQFKGINEFFKASQEQIAARAAEKAASGPVPTLAEMLQQGVTSRRVTFTQNSVSPIPEGKAPSLVEYVTSGFKSSVGGVSGDGLAESKAKLGLLVDNTYSMFGKGAGGGVDLSGLSEGVSPEMAAGLAVAVLLILGIAAKNDAPPVTSIAKNASDDVQYDDGMAGGGVPLTGLAKDLKTMAAQIKALSEDTKNLRNELKQARDKLNQKELAISKERLNTADMELQLKREIQKMNLKLLASENTKKVLEKELAAATGIKVEDIKVEVPPVTEESFPLGDSEMLTNTPLDEPLELSKPEKETAPTPAPAKEATKRKAPAKKLVPEETAATVEEPKAEEPKVEEPKVEEPKVEEPKIEEPKAEEPKAEEPKVEEPKAPATKAKPKSKAKSEKVTSGEVVATKGEDWSSLSASALSRKTVKELTDYLRNKGVKTAGDDGKPLTKATLVATVRSL